jgi:hypothetical protein
MGTRLAAAPIVLDAAYAVVLEDLLATWELALLLAPWEDVVGSPFGDGQRRSPGEPSSDDLDEAWDDGDVELGRGDADEVAGEASEDDGPR